MPARTNSRFLCVAAISAALFAAEGCATPLGPGYHFPDRQAEVRVAGDSPGLIHIRVTDQLVNAGDRTLRSLDVRLPQGREFGQQNLSVKIEGVQVTPVRDSSIDARMMRAPFDPPWKQNEQRNVVTEWDLAPDFSPRGTIVASPDGFFIADETALPLWQTPSGFFARGGTIPQKELLTVISPQDFRVLAAGKPLKPSADGNEVLRRFLIEPNTDFLPFIVAGRYKEFVLQTQSGNVQFWTFSQVVDVPAAQAAAARLSATMKSLRDFFGPASSEPPGVRIAESPAEMPAEFGDATDPGGASFPQGVLLGPRAFQQGIATEPVLQLAEYELARTWYGWRVRPRPEAQIVMGRGVGLFGLVIAAEARGGDERGRMIASLLQRYDAARAAAPDRQMMEPTAGYSRAERVSTGYRAGLFFVALEDLCGRDNLRTALREIIYARASSDTGYEELRAALEAETGRDLAEMFRAWLWNPGVPEDFRSRYSK